MKKKVRLDAASLRVESFATALLQPSLGGTSDDSACGSCVSACGMCATPDWACDPQTA